MARAYSQDLRERVLSATAAGTSARQAAERFGVGVSTAIVWVRRGAAERRADGAAAGTAPAVQARRPRRIPARAGGFHLRHHPERDAGAAARGAGRVGRDRDAVSVLRPPGLQLEKKTAHAAEQDRPDVLAAREAWFDAQPDLDPERLVFIDETGATTKMARTRGRAPRGERLRAGAPHGHWKTTTFVGGLRLGGMTAPMVLGRTHDQRLVPGLHRADPGPDPA